jgi:hypothetical protein
VFGKTALQLNSKQYNNGALATVETSFSYDEEG